jgi:hypothetical protein
MKSVNVMGQMMSVEDGEAEVVERAVRKIAEAGRSNTRVAGLTQEELRVLVPLWRRRFGK